MAKLLRDEMKVFVENMVHVAMSGANPLTADMVIEANTAYRIPLTLTLDPADATVLLELDSVEVVKVDTHYPVKEDTYALTVSKLNYVTSETALVVSRADVIAGLKEISVTLVAA